MNQTIRLYSHQNAAVWRGMSAGNTLLAQAVGAGKTFTMAATGMKMKQAGLLTKPMYVVPNHLLEQFAREFMLNCRQTSFTVRKDSAGRTDEVSPASHARSTSGSFLCVRYGLSPLSPR